MSDVILQTNCEFLENELLDVVRLFKNRPEKIEHAYSYEDGVFQNTFLVDGHPFSFKERGQVTDEIIFKRLERRYAKLALFEIMSTLYPQKMPWGALTGIRPTKLAYMEKASGGDYKTLFQKMQVNEENIRLVERVLKAQEGIYEQKDENTDLFVSIPFCPTKCAYCSFITAPIDKTRGFLPDYLNCLEKELAAALSLQGNLRSIYVGGGTPFVLDEPHLERVLKGIAPFQKEGLEYTVEAGRPDTFTEGKLKLLKEYGVTRICINPQTFSNETLKAIGRKHTVEDVYKAFEMMKRYDFSVNMDLIAGLTGESVETFEEGVKKAACLGADNITVHCLSLKSGAKLKEECSYLEDDGVSFMVARSREILSDEGYEPYYMYRQKYQVGNNENVGWTKPNKACIYNVDIMEETACNLAVGANAISKKVKNGQHKITRFATPKDLKTYLEKIDEIIDGKRKFFQD